MARILILPIAAALALLVVAVVVTDDPEPSRPPGQTDVTQVQYACPMGPEFSLALGQIRPAESVNAEAVPSRSSVPVDPRRWVVAESKGDGVVVDHRGARSGPAGFFSRMASSGVGGGLIVGECPGNVDDAWFVGLGSGGKHQSSLVLSNLADTPAVVDVRLWRPSGEVETVGAEEIVIDPFTTRRVRLADIAAGELELAAHVHRSRGAVSVVANDASTATFKGNEAVTAASAPSLDQVLTGLTEGASGRTLIALNPNSATARVTVTAVGSKGAFVPEGLESIKLKPHELKLVEVPRSAGSGELAFHLTSDLPVVASTRLNPTTTDFAYVESTPILTGQAIVPVEVGQSLDLPELILAAIDSRASARVEAFDEDMKSLDSTRIKVGKNSTVTIDLGSSDVFDVDDIAYVVLTPKGPLRAAATYFDGDRIASLAIISAPVSLAAPQVRPRF